VELCFFTAGAVVEELTKVSDDRQQKPRKLLPLQSRYSDSDSEETREQRKARVVCMRLLLTVICGVILPVFYAFIFMWQLSVNLSGNHSLKRCSANTTDLASLALFTLPLPLH